MPGKTYDLEERVYLLPKWLRWLALGHGYDVVREHPINTSFEDALRMIETREPATHGGWKIENVIVPHKVGKERG